MDNENKDNLDETLNIGTEIRLTDKLTKHINIGTIKTIREIRKIVSEVKYSFAFSFGREKGYHLDPEYDFPKAEAKYREAFNVVLEGGLSDEEYDNVDEKGIKELDTLLTRFL